MVAGLERFLFRERDIIKGPMIACEYIFMSGWSNKRMSKNTASLVHFNNTTFLWMSGTPFHSLMPRII